MINAPSLDIGSPLPQYQNAWLTGVSGEAYGPACRWLAQLTTTKPEKASERINFSYPRAPEVLCLDVSFDTDFILPVITRSGQCFFPFQCSVTTCEIELSFVLAPEGCSSVWQSPLLWWPCPQRSGAGPFFPYLSWPSLCQRVKNQPSLIIQGYVHSCDRPSNIILKGQAWASLWL